MPTLHALGQILEGSERLGDGSGSPVTFSANGFAISYLVAPPGSNGFQITYRVQAQGMSGLLVSYYVVPTVTQFSINGTIVRGPQQIDYNPPQAIGYDLSGIQVKQGYTAMAWNYDVLLDADIGTLMSLYDPNNPGVVITWPDEQGFWRQANAMMHPPTLGTRSTVVHQQVQLLFSHIIPS